MLTRRLLALGTMVVLLLGVPMTASAAAPDVECPPGQTGCTIDDGTPGTPGGDGDDDGGGGGDDGGDSGPCVKAGNVVPCYDPLTGWFNPDDSCYYKLTEPQLPPPPNGDQGAWYTATCDPVTREAQWLEDPPPGFEAPPDPLTLARRALAGIDLLPPDLQVRPNTTGLVGLPIWVWANGGLNVWGPITNRASEQGLTVTISAHVTEMTISFGDGTTISCNDGGTPYTAGKTTPSPDCGHVYQVSSSKQPGKKFTVRAVSKWTVDWRSTASGEGTLPEQPERESTETIRIDELQVVTE
jgi:hypothetical protein